MAMQLIFAEYSRKLVKLPQQRTGARAQQDDLSAKSLPPEMNLALGAPGRRECSLSSAKTSSSVKKALERHGQFDSDARTKGRCRSRSAQNYLSPASGIGEPGKDRKLRFPLPAHGFTADERNLKSGQYSDQGLRDSIWIATSE